MATKRSGSSVRGKHHAKSVKHIPDSKLDFSDIPELSDNELGRARKVGRPITGKAKQLIAIRIAPDLLSKLRKLAAKQRQPYQTLLHELLEGAVKKRAA